MSTNNDDMLRSLKLFESKSSDEKKKIEPKKVEKKEEKLDEFKMKPTPASKKGMFKGKTKAEIRKELTSVKARMKAIEDSGKKVPKSLRTKFSELTFALRAKHNWGTAESKETTTKKKTVKESYDLNRAIDKMLKENFWGGDEGGGSESPISGNDDHEESGSDENSMNDHSEEDSNENQEDVLKIDVPAFLKFMEYARENSKSDEELHELAEKLVQCCDGDSVIDMAKFEELCCCDGEEEVGSDSEEGNEYNFGNSDSSEESDSDNDTESNSEEGSDSEEEEKEPYSVSESMRKLINRLY